MDSILSDEKTVNDLPESSESETTTESKESASEGMGASEKQAPSKSEAKQGQGQESSPKPEDHDGDDEQDQHVPDDLAGLKKALAAARGDKRKARKQWREAENAMAELRGRLTAMERQPTQIQQQQAQMPQPQAVDLTDEEFFGRGPEAVKAYVDYHLREQVSAIRDEQRTRRFNDSEAVAREKHPDFDQALENFKAVARSQPHLWHQMEMNYDPAEFVYRTAKTFEQLQGVNSIDDLRQRIEAEVRAKIESEQSQGQTQRGAVPTPPKSIAGTRGTSPGSSANWSGPRSIDEILR